MVRFVRRVFSGAKRASTGLDLPPPSARVTFAVVSAALVGLGVGVFLVATEYLLLLSGAKERAKRLHRAAELDETERRRVAAVLRFSFILPPGFAALFWLVGG